MSKRVGPGALVKQERRERGERGESAMFCKADGIKSQVLVLNP